MQAWSLRELAATPEGIPRLPLDPKHLVAANFEVEASDQREATDAIFVVVEAESEDEINAASLERATNANPKE